MTYITEDLANHFLSQGWVESGSMFTEAEPSFEELRNALGSNATVPDIIHSVIVTSGTENPKWARGTYFLAIRVRGRSRDFNTATRDRCVDLFNELVGASTIQVGTNLYSQINSSEVPRFSGYFEGSEPIFQFLISVVRESTVDIGNRQQF